HSTILSSWCLLVFFFTQPPPTSLSPLSLHDALPICADDHRVSCANAHSGQFLPGIQIFRINGGPCFEIRNSLESGDIHQDSACQDRKSTRLNSSHEWISYAVFCLKKKKKTYMK